MREEDIKYIKQHKTKVSTDWLREMDIIYKIKISDDCEIFKLAHPQFKGLLELKVNPNEYTTYYTAMKHRTNDEIIKRGEEGFFYLVKRGGEDV